MSLITIDQLLESMNLDFKPRWVTKDEEGRVELWTVMPHIHKNLPLWVARKFSIVVYKWLKLAEFENKHWTECIYEVPRKTTGKIEKLKQTVRGFDEKPSMPTATDFLNKINELVDAVNELKKIIII